jgi:drug/metabolite transporter (DMT)-like permease
MLVIVVSGVYATMWGAPRLNPAVVGLLFMTEISVGAVTAAIWAGEPFGFREIVGVVLISAAGVTESIWDLWLKSRLKRA